MTDSIELIDDADRSIFIERHISDTWQVICNNFFEATSVVINREQLKQLISYLIDEDKRCDEVEP